MIKIPPSTNGNFTRPVSRLGKSSTQQSQAQEKIRELSQSLTGMMQHLGKTIADNPGVSLATALTCGVVVGWFIKRTD